MQPKPKDSAMPENDHANWYHSNRYHADAACEHCQGIIRHERWCISFDAEVHYAYEIVADPTRLTFGDILILHSLGVIWGENSCRDNCQ
jgi:hypothetical protein